MRQAGCGHSPLTRNTARTVRRPVAISCRSRPPTGASHRRGTGVTDGAETANDHQTNPDATDAWPHGWVGLAAIPPITHALDSVSRSTSTQASPHQQRQRSRSRWALARLDTSVPESRVRQLAPPATTTMNRVDRLYVREGETVVAGQLLAEFADAAEKRAAVAQADAQVDEANAELARVVAAGGARMSRRCNSV